MCRILLREAIKCVGNINPSGEQWRREQQQQAQLGLSKAEEACGRELGRWITPFRRRVGRWLTDVTPLWPLLSSRQCRIMGQLIRRVALPEDEEFMGFGTNHVPGPFSTGSVQQATGQVVSKVEELTQRLANSVGFSPSWQRRFAAQCS
ncbi:hypothetical protein WJX75_004755 [Coccomyxa subellipsoidea]|uniref:Peptide-N-glycosidase F N-terminal domain-containing protein n=1 Tax=Coccomyxa subellipsoidea TaxID=248742 RepID=A0ABR2YHC7_9CHLO